MKTKPVKEDINSIPKDLKTIKKNDDTKNGTSTLVSVEADANKIVISLNKCSQNWKTNQLHRVKKPKKIENKNDEKDKIWFDVDHILLPEMENTKKATTDKENGDVSHENNIKSHVIEGAKVTKAIAIDCEMVGVGENGVDSILARVSLVNQLNECIYDKYVIPTETVTDYRTHVSGIRPSDLNKNNGAEKFEVVQKEVSDLIKDRILVGHALHNDLKVLFLSHPSKKVRDTQKCKYFRKVNPSIGGFTSLKTLAQLLLGTKIQDGEHNSVQDAQAAMSLYTMYRKDWENEIKNRKKPKFITKEDGVTTTEVTNAELSGKEKHKRYVERKMKKRRLSNSKFKK